MQTNMPLQSGIAFELGSTNFAPEHASGAMNPKMIAEISTRSESLWTIRTREWPFTCMNTQMDLHGMGFGKFPPAIRTLIEFIAILSHVRLSFSVNKKQ